MNPRLNDDELNTEAANVTIQNNNLSSPDQAVPEGYANEIQNVTSSSNQNIFAIQARINDLACQHRIISISGLKNREKKKALNISFSLYRQQVDQVFQILTIYRGKSKVKTHQLLRKEKISALISVIGKMNTEFRQISHDDDEQITEKIERAKTRYFGHFYFIGKNEMKNSVVCVSKDGSFHSEQLNNIIKKFNTEMRVIQCGNSLYQFSPFGKQWIGVNRIDNITDPARILRTSLPPLQNFRVRFAISLIDEKSIVLSGGKTNDVNGSRINSVFNVVKNVWDSVRLPPLHS